MAPKPKRSDLGLDGKSELPFRTGKAKPKAKGTSRASKPRKAATKYKSPPKAGATGGNAARLIDERIRDLGGWRGETLARMRALILQADPEMTEEWKWMGTPVCGRTTGLSVPGRRTRRS